MTKKAEVDLLIFDLDGTLIESKWDIADSVNLTLRDLGVPERPQEEIFGFVGDGVKKLLRLAVGEARPTYMTRRSGSFADTIWIIVSIARCFIPASTRS